MDDCPEPCHHAECPTCEPYEAASERNEFAAVEVDDRTYVLVTQRKWDALYDELLRLRARTAHSDEGDQ